MTWPKDLPRPSRSALTLLGMAVVTTVAMSLEVLQRSEVTVVAVGPLLVCIAWATQRRSLSALITLAVIGTDLVLAGMNAPERPELLGSMTVGMGGVVAGLRLPRLLLPVSPADDGWQGNTAAASAPAAARRARGRRPAAVRTDGAMTATVPAHRLDKARELLSPRHMEVLLLSLSGCTARQIAARLEIGERTVETHMRQIYRRLDVHSRAELMARFLP